MMSKDKTIFKTPVVQPLEVDSQQLEERYKNMLQGKPTNALTATSGKRASYNPLNDRATITQDDVEIFINKYNSINTLDAKAHKVLDLLTLKLTANFPFGENVSEASINKHRTVNLSVDEYKEHLGLKDTKEARKQLTEAIAVIYNTSLQWQEERWIIPEGKKRRVKTIVPHQTRIIDDVAMVKGELKPIKKGVAEVKFSYTLAEYLAQAYIMPYPLSLLKVNTRLNPNSYYFGKKMVSHHNINAGKANSNIISVKTLLKCTPELPTYNEVMSGNKNIYNRIIAPFERDLTELVTNETLVSWNYCNSKHQPLTDEQKQPLNYDKFIDLYVEFDLTNYPDKTKRLQEKSEKIEKAKARRTAKKKTG